MGGAVALSRGMTDLIEQRRCVSDPRQNQLEIVDPLAILLKRHAA
jgi:hypothetical protein